LKIIVLHEVDFHRINKSITKVRSRQAVKLPAVQPVVITKVRSRQAVKLPAVQPVVMLTPALGW